MADNCARDGRGDPHTYIQIKSFRFRIHLLIFLFPWYLDWENLAIRQTN